MVTMITNQDIATIVYSVGHALRPRFGMLTTKMSELRAALAQRFPDHPDILATALQAQIFASNCLGTANIMNFVAAFLNSQDGSPIKKDFFVKEDYILSQRFAELAALCNQAQQDATVEFDGGDLRLLSERKARIGQSPRLPTNGGRLFDPFYNELFFEMFFNAARYGPKGQSCLRIKIATPIDAAEEHYCSHLLVFSNIIRYPPSVENYKSASGKWFDWSDGPHGGLRFLADCLRLTKTGNLKIRVVEQANATIFEVRIALLGLVLN
jgi:hypothetical protein